ncbi:hypothetical protein FRX31_009235 [Thalictrum thalictroides]|uniref:Uncharacterized protein n=1 Tax=Thalictrum thalictroides TaxID=46969 RepID=A0A7J6WW88_THATH|nr:hypothetical protein FRX31_009235 [Thalictrum thalictroides]
MSGMDHWMILPMMVLVLFMAACVLPIHGLNTEKKDLSFASPVNFCSGLQQTSGIDCVETPPTPCNDYIPLPPTVEPVPLPPPAEQLPITPPTENCGPPTPPSSTSLGPPGQIYMDPYQSAANENVVQFALVLGCSFASLLVTLMFYKPL